MLETNIEEQLRKTFDYLQKEFSDLSPFMRSIASVVKMKIDTNFQDQGRYDGSSGDAVNILSGGANRWQPLKKSTLEAYSATGKTHRGILDSRGMLRKSISSQAIGKSTIALTAGTKYSAIHNFGGKIKVPITKKMRGFFWFMYKKTDNETWKWRALTKKDSFNITIPARPFITLTNDDFLDIVDNITRMLAGVGIK